MRYRQEYKRRVSQVEQYSLYKVRVDNNWERIERKGGQTADEFCWVWQPWDKKIRALKWEGRQGRQLGQAAWPVQGQGSAVIGKEGVEGWAESGYSSDQRKVGPYVYPRTETLHYHNVP